MQRTTLFTVWLTLAFGAMIAVTALVGRGQPVAENVVRLRLTDCAPPCWIGIKPGLTTEGRAQKLFRNVYPRQRPYFIARNSAGSNLQMQTNSYPPQPSDLVTSILILDVDSATGAAVANSTLMPSLGDVLLLWGVPSCTYPSGPQMWTLRYTMGSDGTSVMDIAIQDNRLSPSQPIYYLQFYNAPAEFATRCLRDDTERWGGFARLS